MKPVWNWFGYDEPNYTYMKDGKKLLSEIAALSPTPAFVRVHNLLTTGDGTAALKWAVKAGSRTGNESFPRPRPGAQEARRWGSKRKNDEACAGHSGRARSRRQGASGPAVADAEPRKWVPRAPGPHFDMCKHGPRAPGPHFEMFKHGPSAPGPHFEMFKRGPSAPGPHFEKYKCGPSALGPHLKACEERFGPSGAGFDASGGRSGALEPQRDAPPRASPPVRACYFFGGIFPSRSSTARTISGQATVASAYTSAKRPPSLWGMNFPQLTPSE